MSLMTSSSSNSEGPALPLAQRPRHEMEGTDEALITTAATAPTIREEEEENEAESAATEPAMIQGTTAAAATTTTTTTTTTNTTATNTAGVASRPEDRSPNQNTPAVAGTAATALQQPPPPPLGVEALGRGGMIPPRPLATAAATPAAAASWNPAASWWNGYVGVSLLVAVVAALSAPVAPLSSSSSLVASSLLVAAWQPHTKTTAAAATTTTTSTTTTSTAPTPAAPPETTTTTTAASSIQSTEKYFPQWWRPRRAVSGKEEDQPAEVCWIDEDADADDEERKEEHPQSSQSSPSSEEQTVVPSWTLHSLLSFWKFLLWGNRRRTLADWCTLLLDPLLWSRPPGLRPTTSRLALVTSKRVWKHWGAAVLPGLCWKVWNSTPRLLAWTNAWMVLLYLAHVAVTNWFSAQQQQQSSSPRTGTAGTTNGGWNASTTAGTAGSAPATPTRSTARTSTSPSRHGSVMGYCILKWLLLSAVLSLQNALDLVLLLLWLSVVCWVQSLARLAGRSLHHATVAGQAPPRKVGTLLLVILSVQVSAAVFAVSTWYVGNKDDKRWTNNNNNNTTLQDAASSRATGLNHPSSASLLALLLADSVGTILQVLVHMLAHTQVLMEARHGQELAVLEQQQVAVEEQDAWLFNPDTHRFSPEERQQQRQEQQRELESQMHRMEDLHNRRLSILDVAVFWLQLFVQIVTVLHYLHVWSLHGIQFTLIDGVVALQLHSAVTNAAKKIFQRRHWHKIARDLDGIFATATELELRKAAGDVCCVCLCSLTTSTSGVRAASSGQLVVKKVACGHMFHTGCLREVVERARSIQAAKCPLCRAGVLDGLYMHNANNAGNNNNNNNNNNSPPNNNNNNNNGPEVAPEPNRGEENNPNNNNNATMQNRNDDQAVFRFSTEGILPHWIPLPAFSFEVVRRNPNAADTNANAAMNNAPRENNNNNNINNTNNNNNNNNNNNRTNSILGRIFVLLGAVPMSQEEEATALDQLVDMFPQYERSDLLQELREQGSAEAVAEVVLSGMFTGIAR